MLRILKREACITLVIVICLCLAVKSEVTQNADGTGGTIRFDPPTLNDEESHSRHLPESMKCDACKAIAYHFTEAFGKEHKKNKKLTSLKESDIYRIVEEVCGGEPMKQYGVKEVEGMRKLSGPGLPTAETPGIMQGGGRWPDRMERMCNLYVEEFDEEAIYEAYKNNPEGMEKFLCESNAHKGLTDVCLEKTGKRKKTEL